MVKKDSFVKIESKDDDGTSAEVTRINDDDIKFTLQTCGHTMEWIINARWMMATILALGFGQEKPE